VSLKYGSGSLAAHSTAAGMGTPQIEGHTRTFSSPPPRSWFFCALAGTRDAFGEKSFARYTPLGRLISGELAGCGTRSTSAYAATL